MQRHEREGHGHAFTAPCMNNSAFSQTSCPKIILFLMSIDFFFFYLHGFVSVIHSCFHRRNMGAGGGVLCLSSGMCRTVHVFVWSPRNDYYGLTPISQLASLHPWFFPFSLQWKGKHIPFCRLFLRPFSLIIWDMKTHSHTHTHTKPQTCTSKWQTNIWICMVVHREGF